MSVLHIAVSAEYRERIIKAAGSQWRVSRWINSVVLPAFFNPSGIEELRQENIRLKGEIEGLRYALSTLRPAGTYLLTESADNGSNNPPYYPFESNILPHIRGG